MVLLGWTECQPIRIHPFPDWTIRQPKRAGMVLIWPGRRPRFKRTFSGTSELADFQV